MNITACRLRALREDKGLSQREVALRLGITRAAYNKYECGVSKPVRKLEELSSLFGVSTDYILGKDATSMEAHIQNADTHTGTQIRKYMHLSQESRELVDLVLDALYTRERTKTSNNNNKT